MPLREFSGRKEQPTAMILDSRTLQSTPESRARAGYDGAKRRKGSKVHAAVDTLGRPLALHVTPTDERGRAQVGELTRQVQEITQEIVELAHVDQGYTGEAAEEAAAGHGIQLDAVDRVSTRPSHYNSREASRMLPCPTPSSLAKLCCPTRSPGWLSPERIRC